MESISDFWKSARERFTNPFAFAYLVAWFGYNWKITVALFSTHEYPIQYQNIFDFIADEIVGWDVYFIPFVYAVVYVVFITFMRQAVGVLNVEFDKIGSGIMARRSKGGTVSVDKYLDARKKIEERTTELERLFKQEADKDTNFLKLEEQYASLQTMLGKSQDNLSKLQNTVTTLNNQIATLRVLEQENVKLKQDGQQIAAIVDKMRSTTVFEGIWRVDANDDLGSYQFEVAVYRGTYYTPSRSVKIDNFFFDAVNQEMFFSLSVKGGTDDLITKFYTLKAVNPNTWAGKEDQYLIRYSFVKIFDREHKLKDYVPSRAVVHSKTKGAVRI